MGDGAIHLSGRYLDCSCGRIGAKAVDENRQMRNAGEMDEARAAYSTWEPGDARCAGWGEGRWVAAAWPKKGRRVGGAEGEEERQAEVGRYGCAEG